MFCLLYSVADVDWLMSMNMLKIGSHVESNSIDHSACAVVFKFQFYMFKIFANKFAGPEVKHIACAKHGVLISRPKRIKFLEICHKLRSDVGES